MPPSKTLLLIEMTAVLLAFIGGIVGFSLIIDSSLKSIARDKHLVYLSSLPGEPCNVTAISHAHRVAYVWDGGRGAQYTSSRFAHALHVGQATQCYGDDTRRLIQRVTTIDKSNVRDVGIFAGLIAVFGLAIIGIINIAYHDLRNPDFSWRVCDTRV